MLIGERTRSHFFGETVDRFTTIDMYRRPATNYPGRVVMDCGRPGDGYYTQKYPCKRNSSIFHKNMVDLAGIWWFFVAQRTWFGSSYPLNRRPIMDGVYRKTWRDYEAIKAAEFLASQERKGIWPDRSEYTESYLIKWHSDSGRQFTFCLFF